MFLLFACRIREALSAHSQSRTAHTVHSSLTSVPASPCTDFSRNGAGGLPKFQRLEHWSRLLRRLLGPRNAILGIVPGFRGRELHRDVFQVCRTDRRTDGYTLSVDCDTHGISLIDQVR